ncbi:putative acetyltransferase [Inhella inkyongensis]|uniref:Putative acetyltransferase n=1 Tax=Inhella inkyongensis TaxID=392593 RepID=A0A840S621_9BURK|nr:GNAT family N-acetyltransferase [Inhella inkyongensis]MBB5204244.1 putative acetyltransferase [Inhella inkyongensis]
MKGTLTIRRAVPTDAPGFVRIVADPAVFGGLLQLPYPTEALWRQRIEAQAQVGSTDWILVAERGGVLLGHAGLHAVPGGARRAHVRSLGVAVAVDAQRQGVGSALLTALCDLADNWLGVLRLELGVYTDNAPAIALYERLGFVTEGVHRGDALRDGRYVDTLSMARWHPRPPQGPRPE